MHNYTSDCQTSCIYIYIYIGVNVFRRPRLGVLCLFENMQLLTLLRIMFAIYHGKIKKNISTAMTNCLVNLTLRKKEISFLTC